MILFIGKEIAELISPFVMWGAIAATFLALIGLVVWRIRKSAKKEAKAEVRDDIEKDRHGASEDYRKTRRRMGRAALRGWLRHREGGSDPTPGAGDRDGS